MISWVHPRTTKIPRRRMWFRRVERGDSNIEQAYLATPKMFPKRCVGSSEVVEARPEDWQAVGRFFTEAWRLAGPGALGWIGASDQVVAEMTTKEALLEMLTRPNTRTLIARDRQRVVGLASIKKIDDRTAELSGVVVRQDHIGRGIGSKLLEKARSTAVADGFRTMTVSTEVNNERAIRFYTSKGFHIAEEKEQDVLGNKVKLLKLILVLKKI